MELVGHCGDCRYWTQDTPTPEVGVCNLIGVGTLLNRHAGCPFAGIVNGVGYLHTHRDFGCVHFAVREEGEHNGELAKNVA